MPIYLFLASLLFAFAVARRKHLRLLSPFGVMIVFQALYNVTPWLIATMGANSFLFPLLFDVHTINIQLTLASMANFSFSLVFLLFYRNVQFSVPRRTFKIARRNYILLSLPVFLLTCALCEKYGWHQLTFAAYDAGSADTIGGMFTVTAYFKFFFVAIYLYYLYRFGLDKVAWILIGEHVIVLMIDGARATFLPVFIMTLFILIDTTNERKRLRTIYLVAVGGVMVSTGARALIIHDSNLLSKMVAPVAIEGAMGDYSCLQSIHAVETLRDPHYTLGATYVIDPLVWLIPRAMGREDLSSLSRWTKGLSGTLTDEFAPMGGFYYLSEAIANFSYLGPVIVTPLFAAILIWIDHRKNSHRLLYLAWMPTLGLMFVKVRFGNGFKLFIIELLSLQLLSTVGKMKRFLPQKPYGSEDISQSPATNTVLDHGGL